MYLPTVQRLQYSGRVETVLCEEADSLRGITGLAGALGIKMRGLEPAMASTLTVGVIGAVLLLCVALSGHVSLVSGRDRVLLEEMPPGDGVGTAEKLSQSRSSLLVPMILG